VTPAKDRSFDKYVGYIDSTISSRLMICRGGTESAFLSGFVLSVFICLKKIETWESCLILCGALGV